MQSILRYLIIAGLVLWGFFLIKEYQPFGLMSESQGHIEDANTSARCAEFSKDIEGERAMDYRDRIRQFMSGCW